MRFGLSARIAWRYLITKKSHGAVGTISTVSVCAMAVATAAIICVLSVFNGFKREIGVRLDTLSPDVKVTPASGKTFADAERLAERISGINGVEVATPTLEDNALVIYNGQEMPVKVKGVYPEQYAAVTSIKSLFRENFGSFISGETDDEKSEPEADYEPTPAAIAVGVASRLRAYPESRMLIFAPKREGRVNMANPLNSFLTDSLNVSGVYSAEQSQYDDDGVILHIDAVRRLLQYDTEASAIEVKARQGVDPALLAGDVAAATGKGFVVKDRFRQQEMNFRMVNIEKWVSFLLLGFILLIASFNIISSLSMLVLEKEDALSSFAALGLSRRRIGGIFAWESIYVSLAGGLIGIAVGLALCALQEHFGFIKIGASETVSVLRAYPVEIRAMDVIVTIIPIIAIGAITALITAQFAKSRLSQAK